MNTFVFLFFGGKSTKTEGDVFSGKVTILARVIVAEKMILVEIVWGEGVK